MSNDDGWVPGRWYFVIGPDGEHWCQTSLRAEAVGMMRPGDRLYRQWICERLELREETP